MELMIGVSAMHAVLCQHQYTYTCSWGGGGGEGGMGQIYNYIVIIMKNTFSNILYLISYLCTDCLALIYN